MILEILKRKLLKTLIFVICLVCNKIKAVETPQPEEYLVFTKKDGAFVASVENGKLSITKILSSKKSKPKIGVSSNHEALWILKDKDLKIESDLENIGFKIIFLDKKGISTLFGHGMSLSPDNKKLVYVVSGGTGLNLCSENLDTGEVVNLTSGWGYIIEPSWSPDGNMIVFYGEKRLENKDCDTGLSLFLIDAFGKNEKEIAGPSKILRFGGEDREPVVWSPKSDIVFFEACYEDDKFGSWVYAVNTQGNTIPTRVMSGRCLSISEKDGILFVGYKRNTYSVQLKDNVWQKEIVDVKGSPKISPSGKMLAYNTQSGFFSKIVDDGPELLIDKDSQGSFSDFYWVRAKDTIHDKADKIEEK